MNHIEQALNHGMDVNEIAPEWPYNYEGDHKAYIISRDDLPKKMYLCLNGDGTILEKKMLDNPK